MAAILNYKWAKDEDEHWTCEGLIMAVLSVRRVKDPDDLVGFPTDCSFVGTVFDIDGDVIYSGAFYDSNCASLWCESVDLEHLVESLRRQVKDEESVVGGLQQLFEHDRIAQEILAMEEDS